MPDKGQGYSTREPSGTLSAHRENRGVLIEMWVVDLLDGDLPAVVLFSQLRWWHQPGKDRLAYERSGQRWLLRADHDWWDECRLTQSQVRRIRRVLLAKGVVEHRRFKLDGAPTSAWRLDSEMHAR